MSLTRWEGESVNAPTLFLVRRTGLKWQSNRGFIAAYADSIDSPDDQKRYVAESVFTKRHIAEEHATLQELAMWRQICPFAGLTEEAERLSNVSPSNLFARLSALGLLLPKSSPPIGRGSLRYHWPEWWRDILVALPDEVLRDVMNLFNKVRFFDVVEIPVED
jgi:hypothetical protein